MANLVFFECTRCAGQISPAELAAPCPRCGGPLVARYDLADREQGDGPQAPSGGAHEREELPKRRALGGIIQPY